MFSKRHEQELAEIKALTLELTRRFQEILEGVRSIQATQERLLAADRSVTDGPDSGNGDVAAEPSAGSKRQRRKRSAPAVAAAVSKSSKRRQKAGSEARVARTATNGPARKKRRATEAEAGSDTDED